MPDEAVQLLLDGFVLSVRAALPVRAVWRYFDRPVSPVARRELTLGDLALFGPSPLTLLPATTDEELAAFIRRDLRGELARAFVRSGIDRVS
jgi:hypothetical protein